MKHYAPRQQHSLKKDIFSTKVIVKVTRSLTLVSLFEYACQIWTLYLYGSKVIANVKVDNRQTNRQDKNNKSPIIRSGGIKILFKEQLNLHRYDPGA